MLTQKDAKTMAKSLRLALGNRNVLLSHSDCLEIVARQFGLADWNTLLAKLSDEQELQPIRQQLATAAPPTASRASSAVTKSPSASSLGDGEAEMKRDDTTETSQASAPWTTCSFCGKSRPEVQILLGGCGGWEGFRARRNPPGGERSNVFICNECVALTARMLNHTDAAGNRSSISPQE